jgi:plastocyanin
METVERLAPCLLKKENTIMKRLLMILSKGFGVLTLLAGLGLGVWADGPKAVSAPAPEAKTQVEINNFSFSPSTLTVPVGTQVIWINKDETTHNVVSSDKTIRSAALDTDGKFTFTFTKAGTYSYICTIHPRMKGTVVVQ